MERETVDERRYADDGYHGSDICECGDFRSQHNPVCMCGCSAFRFSHVASGVVSIPREQVDSHGEHWANLAQS